jgi:hypothetical protein
MPYKFLNVLMILSISTQLNSQEILDQLAAKLTKEYSNNAKELIVMQTDKSIYRAGSEIWFRVYSISSNSSAVQNKDRVIYVELVNDKDNVIDRVLLNKDSLQYNGSIPLRSDIKDGFYQLRVYTKTILQQYPNDMFVSSVYIMNDGKNEIKTSQTISEPISKFYVEGDNLINGVLCMVVFTAADKEGKPVDISGTVKYNFNNEVAKFSGNGLGKIVFEPYSKDRTYKVNFKTNNSAEQTYLLPAIRTGAFQLSLQKHTKDEFVFRVALGDSAYNKKASSYLLGMANGKVCFASSGSIMYMVNVPVSSLPHGIIDFYLFDQNKELKSKRTVFNDNYNSAVNITTDKPEYGSRQKTKLNFTITDYEGKPVKAVFSVSVTDKDLFSEKTMHAADNYLLSRSNSDVRNGGFIENSETRDLFTVAIKDKETFLKNVEVKTPGNFYWDGLEIKGNIADKQNSPLANQIVVLMSDEEGGTLNDSTDNKGDFVFHNMTFYGKKRFHVMLPSVYDKQQKYDVKEDPITYPLIKTNSSNLNDLSQTSWSSFKRSYADSSVSGDTKIYLQKLALDEEKNGNKKNKSSKSNGLLGGRRITAEQLDKLSLSNTADAVKMLPGVMMMGGRLTIRGGLMTPTGDLSDIEPLLVVDGVQTRASSVVDYLNSISPQNIEYIEVFSGPEASQFGTRGGNGAIVVKTSNEIRVKKDDKERQTIVASGFYKEQNFYQPPYDSYTVREASFTDNRATIYWNGEVITDNAGKASISFYTADGKNDYMVTVQGITEKGELIFKTYTIKKK